MTGGMAGMPGIPSELEITVQTWGLYIFVLLIHLAVSLMMAPLSQLVGVLYIAYAMVGTPTNLAGVISGFFFKTAKSFITEVKIDCNKSVFSNKEEIFGGFDNFAYLYGYRYWFFFIMMLFFFFKTIQSAVEMKILALRTAVSTMNAYITATMAVIYSAHVYFEKRSDDGLFPTTPKTKTENGSGKSLKSVSDIFSGLAGQSDPSSAAAAPVTSSAAAAATSLFSAVPSSAVPSSAATAAPAAATSLFSALSPAATNIAVPDSLLGRG